MRVTAIIPVAGSGKRFGGDTPKQYLALKGEPIIAITVRKFLQLKEIYSIIVVTAADEIARMKDLLGKIPGFNLKAEINGDAQPLRGRVKAHAFFYLRTGCMGFIHF